VGKLIDSIFQGESQLLVVKLNSDDDDGQEVRVRVPNESVTQKALPLVGENVTIGLKVADSYVVS
jgi:putative spermidine/putrescine transport system ATP-binding protein